LTGFCFKGIIERRSKKSTAKPLTIKRKGPRYKKVAMEGNMLEYSINIAPENSKKIIVIANGVGNGKENTVKSCILLKLS